MYASVIFHSPCLQYLAFLLITKHEIYAALMEKRHMFRLSVFSDKYIKSVHSL